MAAQQISNFELLIDRMAILWQALDSSKSISTIILVTVALVARSLIVAWLHKNTEIAPHIINHWNQRLRHATSLIIVILILIIWAPELRTFAVTLVAVAAAIVIALKEIITCFTGSIIRATVEGTRIGGRIVINNVHGDVVATDMMSTTILEVNDHGQRTGRTVVLPNSFFITNPTITESADDRIYILMMLGIPVKKDGEWQAIETILLEAGMRISEPYIKEAKKHFARFNRRYGFNAPGPEPKVLIDWTEPEKIIVNLRMAVPVTEQNAIRQEILRIVLRESFKQLPKTTE